MFNTPPQRSHRILKSQSQDQVKSNCKKCDKLDTQNMVRCDSCDGWFHYECGGVDDDVANRVWVCDMCKAYNEQYKLKSTSIKAFNVAKPSKGTKSHQDQGSSAHSHVSSHRSGDLRLEFLTEMEDVQDNLAKAKMNIEQSRLAEKFIVDKAKRDAEFIKLKYDALVNLDDDGVSVKSKKTEASDLQNRVKDWVASVGHGPKHSTKLDRPASKCESQSALSESSLNRWFKTLHGSEIVTPTTPLRKPPEVVNELMRRQVAARQGLSKELPLFSGVAGEWPFFISAFETSTKTCGYTNDENLIRLQKSLKGEARTAVCTRLSLPDNVPGIIETLRMLYGTKEKVFNSILESIRKDPLPKADNLKSLIEFALSVQNLCATAESLGMQRELDNSILLQELSDKLPPQIKLNWGVYKVSLQRVDLKKFSDWLYTLAEGASSVTISKPQKPEKPEKPEIKPNNNRAHLYAHIDDQKGKSTKSSPRLSISSNATPNDTKCHLCNVDSHQINQCHKFDKLSAAEKWSTVRTKKLCRFCLGAHFWRNCKSKTVCGIDSCELKHHPKLHNNNRQTVSTVNNSATGTNTKSTVAEVNDHNVHSDNGNRAMLRYIPVILYGLGRSVEAVAFLDDGSTRTMIEDDLVKELNLNGPIEALCMKWTGNVSRIVNNSRRLSFKISGVGENNKKYQVKLARSVPDMQLPKQSLDVTQLAKDYRYLREVPASSYKNVAARVLIGIDNWKLLMGLRVIERGWDDPVAVKTRLGWEIHGEKGKLYREPLLNIHDEISNIEDGISRCDEVSPDEKLHQMIVDFFSLENFGVKVPKKALVSSEEKRSLEILEATTKKLENRYEVGLLWKNDKCVLPDSLPMAKIRFASFEKQLKLKPELRVMEQMNGYIEKNYVRKLNDDEILRTSPRTSYLPIFPKMNSKKPKKVRLVWDAAAKVDNISLNSMLLAGPDQTTCLPDILRRFREGEITIVGDIKEMFHQIRIREQDQDSQRFLWPTDANDPTKKFDTYVLQVLSFGATCSPSTAQYIKNRNAKEYAEEFPRAVIGIVDNHYVDDWLDAFDTVEETIRVANQVKDIHSNGGFEIRNWISNSSEVMKALSENQITTEQKLNCDFETQTERVLGMYWCIHSDIFTFSLKHNPLNEDVLHGRKIPTKREVLRTLMSIYDPLGLLASFLVFLKILLQDIWRTNISWDEQIDSKLNERWMKWIQLLPQIEQIGIPRYYSIKLKSFGVEIQLHTFVDASESAYSAVAYFRIEDENGIVCVLIGAKTKVAPLKPLSIPKLELQSFVLGNRFAKTIREGERLRISRCVIWTDSITVIRWLYSDHRRYNQFVGVRIGEILESSPRFEWKWVPGKLNVADLATKWKRNPDLSSSSAWFKGPEFLSEQELYWPKPNFDLHEEPSEELRTCYSNYHSDVVINVRPGRVNVNIEKFSNWRNLVRVHALVMRYCQKFLESIHGKKVQNCSNVRTCVRTYLEYSNAEKDLFRKAQLDGYFEEVVDLMTGKVNVKRSSQIFKLLPYLDVDGVMRMRGRIDAAKFISQDARRPIILPNDHYITYLIVRHYHERFFHQNHETTVNEIKQKFYIFRLRVLLKKVRIDCQHCKNQEAVPRAPEMADIPEARLSPFTRPFSYTGIDYAGPIDVIFGRRTEKRWIVLMTCLAIRAAHIEIAHSSTTDSCIMCLRNFICRRGRPLEIFSDNGTNLRGSDNELRAQLQQVDQNRLAVEFTSCYTKWNFNPPASPHMGGIYERLVRSVKTTLAAVMPNRKPNDETLRCWLMEVENVINSRPLTFVPTEPDSQEALTTNHFLLGTSNGNLPPGDFDNEGTILRRNWRIAQQLTNHFWRRWIKEYLPIITRRTKWFENTKPIEVNDVVIVVDEKNPRNKYPKGRIVEVMPDKTGKVRSAKVKIIEVIPDKDGKIRSDSVTKANIYVRPAVKLAVLDVQTRQ